MKGQIAPPMMEYPDKLFYRIREVSKIAGVKPYVLRYWESEFPDLSPEKGSSDQRRYRKKDIQTVLAIRKLLYEDKYTIKGARNKLREELRKWRERGDQRRENARPAAAAAEVAEPAAKPIVKARSSSVPAAKNDTSKMKEELAELRRETLALLNYLDE